MNDITVRRLAVYGEDELFRLEGIETECFGGEAWSRESIRGFLNNAAVVTVVTRVGEDIAGMACAMIVCDEAEILKVAVRGEYRRRGSARAMISELERELRRMGVARLLLEVRDGNSAARALYESLGFSEYGVRRAYYTSPREDAILMEKRLDAHGE